MTDEDIIRHCAPTLAGIKTANLFTCPIESRDTLRGCVRSLNSRLSSKGLRVLPLRFSEKNALIYLYRPRKLSRDLSDEQAAALLRCQGYDTESCQKCLVHLARKLRAGEDFPHEIGLFLGYPPEDVKGFMDHDACGCKCSGCWKVYGDETAAKKKFDQFKKCSRVYMEQFSKGKCIERLTVAG